MTMDGLGTIANTGTILGGSAGTGVVLDAAASCAIRWWRR